MGNKYIKYLFVLSVLLIGLFMFSQKSFAAVGDMVDYATGANPIGVTFDPITNSIWVTNYGADTVSKVNIYTGTKTDYATGTNPLTAVFDSTTNSVWVTNYNANTVSKMNIFDGTKTDYVVGNNPNGITFDPVTNSVWVTNYSDNTVSKININTGTKVDYATLNNPTFPTFDTITNSVWIPNRNSDKISKINITTGTKVDYATGTNPLTAVFDSTTNSVWVTNSTNNTVSKINITTGTKVDYATGTNPYGITFDTITNSVWVTNYSDNTVSKININTGTKVDYATGTNPYGIAFDFITNSIWIANYNSNNTVSKMSITNIGDKINYPLTNINALSDIFDPVTNSVWVIYQNSDLISKINIFNGNRNDYATGGNTYGIGFDPATSSVWVGNGSSTNVAKINALNGARVNYPAGSWPMESAFDPVTNSMWFSNENNGTKLSKFDINTGTRTDYNSLNNPVGIAFDPITNSIWTTSNIPTGQVSKFNIFDGTRTDYDANVNPLDLVFDPVTNSIWAVNANQEVGNLSKFNVNTGARTDYTVIGEDLQSIAFDSTTNSIWAGSNSHNHIIKVNINNGFYIKYNTTYPINSVRSLAFDSVTNSIWAVNANGTIDKISIGNNTPTLTNLLQLKSDQTTSISESSTIPQSSVSFKAAVTNSAGNQSKLEVELKKIDQAFDGSNIQLSSLVDSGTDATVTINNLSDGNYHWRARAVDATGTTSAWQEFGTAGNTDFVVQKPVLIVPGIMGSFWDEVPGNLDDVTNLRLDPILHTYHNLRYEFDANGYTPNVDLFEFPYDWRNVNESSANILKDKLASIRQICECEKINVIAHSMGGLVARYYIEGDLYNNDIDKLFLLGTPNEGASFAYLAWEAGEITPRGFITDFGNKMLETLFRRLGHGENYQDNFSYIRNRVFSVQELLPVYDYLKNLSGTLFTYPSGYPENTFLDFSSGLNSVSGLYNLKNRGVTVINISGNNSNLDTLDTIRIVPSSSPTLWEHGYPEGYDDLLGDHGLSQTAGDGTVPLYSSAFLSGNNISNTTITSSHGDLPTNAINYVFHAIRGVDPAPISYIGITDMLVVGPYSPVDIQIIDPNGNKIGKNFGGGENFNEIPLAYYTGSDNPEMEFATIPNPADGEYRIVAKGTDTGSYVMETNYISDEGTWTKDFTANTNTGVAENLDFNLSTAAPDDTVITPADQTPPTTTISLSGTPGTNGWYASNVEVTFSATDNVGGVGVWKTEYSLDGGFNWITYTSPFTISNESANNTVQYRSQDYVNNLESTHTQSIKLDKTPPEANIHFNPTNRYFTIDGTDNVSTTITTKQNDQNYTVKDESGHTAKINLTAIYLPPYVTAGNAATVSGASLDVIIKSIKYDSNPTITLPINNLHYEWTNTTVNSQSILKTLTQSITILGKVVLNSTYDSLTNKTIINKTQGTTNITQILNGMNLLRLTTDKGRLGFEY